MKQSMNFSFKSAEESPGFLLWRLTNLWQQQQRKALQPLGITHPQFVALAGILWLSNQYQQGPSQNQVAEFTHIDKMMMSDLVKTLLQKALIERYQQETDRRAYSLHLTKKGHQLTLDAIPLVEGVDATFFTNETQGLSGFLTILNQRMTVHTL
ncbi:MarR family winged helix-turn-helix transcriptional regulator [Candidatus Berkiella aquae]|uniref:MarR family transcriptional regulator n=1 Tax=Candidatus Berkiella aquae TaxID=295108 RepID=A0A0Q9YPX6_9GAMM|nr:MarR family transcriptional regulator [Candidatus Berkiella aquae]MCS5711871.1 MarR family transcriptional regulator [Candidatus Berkiella aquae]